MAAPDMAALSGYIPDRIAGGFSFPSARVNFLEWCINITELTGPVC